MISAWSARCRSQSGGGAAGLLDALCLCVPALSPAKTTRRRPRPQPLDAAGQLTLSCARSAEMWALNRRVAHSLDVREIAAWQTQLQVRSASSPAAMPTCRFSTQSIVSQLTVASRHFEALEIFASVSKEDTDYRGLRPFALECLVVPLACCEARLNQSGCRVSVCGNFFSDQPLSPSWFDRSRLNLA